MSVHYGYNYKNALLKKLKEVYEKEIEQNRISDQQEQQLEEAKQLILNFFEGGKEDLYEIERASEGVVQYKEMEDNVLVSLTIQQNYIRFIRQAKSIAIELGLWKSEDDIVESAIYSYIVPGEKRCKLRKVGKVHDGSNFDENVINSYIRKAFKETLGND